MSLRLVSSNSSPEPGDDELTLTPRQMRIMATMASVYADDAYDDLETLGDAPVTAESDLAVLDYFPPVTWTCGARFRRGLARAFDDLAADIDAGRDPEPRCTAEETALHIVLRRASGADDEEIEHMIDGVPPHLRDGDWVSPLEYRAR